MATLLSLWNILAQPPRWRANISFIAEEGAEPQIQKFVCDHDAREDETIQTTLVKIIERAEVASLTEVSGVSIIKG